jgi:hypothetical protein
MMDSNDGVAANAANDDEYEVAVIDEWRDHPLRAFLEDELLNYNIPLDINSMGPTEVWETYCNREDTAPLFDGMVFGVAFKRRLKALRKQVSNNLDRAAVDQLAFDIHRRNFPYEPFDAQGNLNWYGSQAEDLLEEDLAEGLYPDMTPSELYATRPEYQEFSLKVFRGHLHQSIQTAKYHHTLKTKDAEAKAEKQRAREKKKKAAEKKAAKAAAKAAKAAAAAAAKAAKAAKAAATAAAKRAGNRSNDQE